MERCQGIVVRTRIPEAYENIPDAPQQMSRALVDAIADFHAVNYEALGLGDLGKASSASTAGRPRINASHPLDC